jgi:hypothetical protein
MVSIRGNLQRENTGRSTQERDSLAKGESKWLQPLAGNISNVAKKMNVLHIQHTGGSVGILNQHCVEAQNREIMTQR